MTRSPNARVTARFIISLNTADNPPRRWTEVVRMADAKRAVSHAQKRLLHISAISYMFGLRFVTFEIYQEVDEGISLLVHEGDYESAREAFPNLYKRSPGKRKSVRRKDSSIETGNDLPIRNIRRKNGDGKGGKSASQTRIKDTRRTPSYIQLRLLELRRNAENALREQKDQ